MIFKSIQNFKELGIFNQSRISFLTMKKIISICKKTTVLFSHTVKNTVLFSHTKESTVLFWPGGDGIVVSLVNHRAGTQLSIEPPNLKLKRASAQRPSFQLFSPAFFQEF